MSTDLNIRPVGSPPPAPIVLQSPAVSDAVQTVLPSGQSVTAADIGNTSNSVRDQQAQAANDAFVSHQAYYDRSAGVLVFQVVNGKTDEVVDQYPDEAVLRRRAYFHALDLQKDGQRVIPTDRTA